jgi:hypothetical protein
LIQQSVTNPDPVTKTNPDLNLIKNTDLFKNPNQFNTSTGTGTSRGANKISAVITDQLVFKVHRKTKNKKNYTVPKSHWTADRTA